MVHAGGNGDLMAEVAGELDHADTIRFGGILLEQREGSVGATVIHVDQFPVTVRQALQHGHHALVKRRQHSSFVEHRNHDGEAFRLATRLVGSQRPFILSVRASPGGFAAHCNKTAPRGLDSPRGHS